MAYATNARPSLEDMLADIIGKQAEISFKAGMKEVVEWVKENYTPESHPEDRHFNLGWQAELEEWGL